MDEFKPLNEWQIEETDRALAEADHGDFASEDEVRQTFSRWKLPRD
jgi:RHH-type transcriptional regulator, rel operon repressor / antitoxin RelB